MTIFLNSLHTGFCSTLCKNFIRCINVFSLFELHCNRATSFHAKSKTTLNYTGLLFSDMDEHFGRLLLQLKPQPFVDKYHNKALMGNQFLLLPSESEIFVFFLCFTSFLVVRKHARIHLWCEGASKIPLFLSFENKGNLFMSKLPTIPVSSTRQ